MTTTTETTSSDMTSTDWQEICALDKLESERGVAALLDGRPIAIFRITTSSGDEVYAVDHVDPRTQSPTMARGLVGSAKDEPIVISPLLKDRFSLITGKCLNDEQLALRTYEAGIENGCVYVRTNVTPAKQD